MKENPGNAGALFVPVISGSDKTTVSVATGQNEYYPLYISIGNIHNNVRHAHRESVVPIGFLSIPKGKPTFLLASACSRSSSTGERKHDNDPAFLRFRRHLFHSSLSAIFQSLKSQMTTPQVMRCPDGHFRHVIYGLGPYIADYPEQALLSCVVQGWCTKYVSFQVPRLT